MDDTHYITRYAPDAVYRGIFHPPKYYYSSPFNGHRASVKWANSFWQFLHFWHSTISELLVCLQYWQFRLPWHSFVRVQIYYKYWLSINRKNSITELKIFHGAVLIAPAFRSRGREFEFRTLYFPPDQIIFFSLSFLFIFLNFEVKQYVRIYIESTTKTITLAVFDITAFSTESQVLYSFIIKVRMDTPNFYYLTFFITL